ncbi:MAG: hypothetical protein R6U98_05410 [Pirellulaceae bacterium]
MRDWLGLEDNRHPEAPSLHDLLDLDESCRDKELISQRRIERAAKLRHIQGRVLANADPGSIALFKRLQGYISRADRILCDPKAFKQYATELVAHRTRRFLKYLKRHCDPSEACVGDARASLVKVGRRMRLSTAQVERVLDDYFAASTDEVVPEMYHDHVKWLGIPVFPEDPVWPTDFDVLCLPEGQPVNTATVQSAAAQQAAKLTKYERHPNPDKARQARAVRERVENAARQLADKAKAQNYIERCKKARLRKYQGVIKEHHRLNQGQLTAKGRLKLLEVGIAFRINKADAEAAIDGVFSPVGNDAVSQTGATQAVPASSRPSSQPGGPTRSGATTPAASSRGYDSRSTRWSPTVSVPGFDSIPLALIWGTIGLFFILALIAFGFGVFLAVIGLAVAGWSAYATGDARYAIWGGACLGVVLLSLLPGWMFRTTSSWVEQGLGIGRGNATQTSGIASASREGEDWTVQVESAERLGFCSAVSVGVNAAVPHDELAPMFKAPGRKVYRVGGGIAVEGFGPGGEVAWISPSGRITVSSEEGLSSKAALNRLRYSLWKLLRVIKGATQAKLAAHETGQFVKCGEFYTPLSNQYQRLFGGLPAHSCEWKLEWPNADVTWGRFLEQAPKSRDSTVIVNEEIVHNALFQIIADLEHNPYDPLCLRTGELRNLHFGSHRFSSETRNQYKRRWFVIDAFFPQPTTLIALRDVGTEPAIEGEVGSQTLASLRLPDPASGDELLDALHVPPGLVCAEKLGLEMALAGDLGNPLRMGPVRQALEREFGDAVEFAHSAAMVQSLGSPDVCGWVFEDGRVVVGDGQSLADWEHLASLTAAWERLAKVVAAVTAEIAITDVSHRAKLDTNLFTSQVAQHQRVVVRDMHLADLTLWWPESTSSSGMLRVRWYWKVFLDRKEKIRFVENEWKEASLGGMSMGEHIFGAKPWGGRAATPALCIEGFFDSPSGRIALYDAAGQAHETHVAISKPIRLLYLPPPRFGPANRGTRAKRRLVESSRLHGIRDVPYRTRNTNRDLRHGR